MGCPEDSPGCRPQAKTKADDGCGKELAYWAKLFNPPKRKKKKVAKPKVKKKKKKVVKKKRKRQIQLADLPQACAVVLNASGPANETAATMQLRGDEPVAPAMKAVARAVIPEFAIPLEMVTTPTFRPKP